MAIETLLLGLGFLFFRSTFHDSVLLLNFILVFCFCFFFLVLNRHPRAKQFQVFRSSSFIIILHSIIINAHTAHFCCYSFHISFHLSICQFRVNKRWATKATVTCVQLTIAFSFLVLITSLIEMSVSAMCLEAHAN